MAHNFDAKVQKLAKQLIARTVNSWRWLIAHPSWNAIGLILIFWFLGWHFEPETIGKLQFENEGFGFLAGCFYYFIPVLLLANSFLFKREWIVILSAVPSGCLSVLMVCVLFLGWCFGASSAFIRQTVQPDGQITRLYERLDPGWMASDNRYCRYLMLQTRVFPGILRNEFKIGPEVCHGKLERSSFPNNLK
jgi:hypothetical protein